MSKKKDPLEYFRLKPIKAAKVSEVSETTASSGVPAEERVNFHIGNPVQDKQLSSAYLRLILGLAIDNPLLTDDNLDEFVKHLEMDGNVKVKVEFLSSLIKKSAPYMPRGGYNKSNPNFLIKAFNEWLLKNQPEPLAYDLGEISGKREIILASGGVDEALRILFLALPNYILNQNIKFILYGKTLPQHLLSIPSLQFASVPQDETKLVKNVRDHLLGSPAAPTFLILGKNTSEETRRNLRHLSLELPLFFIETNNAPNHLSLAREAKMMNRVLRFLTPQIFSPRYANLSTVFIVGNSDFIKVIETIHFQLKGTPSASEVELLSFLIKEGFGIHPDADRKIEIDPSYESSLIKIAGERTAEPYTRFIENKLSETVERVSNFLECTIEKISIKENTVVNRSNKLLSFLSFDKFSEKHALDLLDEFVENIDSSRWFEELISSFLHSFVKHHPEYNIKNCIVISGSSRTGLGLLGFHCGIKEVIIPDLSWTYEHCFPKVKVVPLTDNFELDVDALIGAVEKALSEDPHWNEYGAIALNNPHNATGQQFNSEELKRLLIWALRKNVFVIDDLSYQNVEPVDALNQIKTIRQLTDELHSAGYITREQSNLVVTVHSVSKTDSLAGARLSVMEIRNEELFKKVSEINSTIQPNIAAIFLTYLFYRNHAENVNAYWRLRNVIFKERMASLSEAVNNLPRERNRYNIEIKAPTGSMYPQMIINKLPAGLSLDWLATGLARQGIGLIPLSTFARTEKGFEAGRRTFRLTLGGTDDSEILLKKTRRVLIDLNRMIAEEAANYNCKQFRVIPRSTKKLFIHQEQINKWNFVENKIKELCIVNAASNIKQYNDEFSTETYYKTFENEFVPVRLSLFKRRFEERLNIANELMESALADKGKNLTSALEREFYKDNLEKRERSFKQRLYDRTVHPTQMYSLRVDLLFQEIIELLIRNKNVPVVLIQKLAAELTKEYFGLNVSIVSAEEPFELILDLDTLIAAENFTNLHSEMPFQTFLSFWGDWDGSNRPSGQGHSLIAAVLIENVARQSRLIQLILKSDKSIKIEQNLLSEIEKLPEKNKRFSNLLNDITSLTHQLEKRYRGILPFNLKPGRVRELGMRLHIARDPLTSLWHHNDRTERRMLELRMQRRNTLEHYFSLNKQMRKVLHSLIPSIIKNMNNEELFLEACLYKDLLKRFVITPRIHQKLITAQDQFAIDTTIHNINEINEISGKYGNPGMVLALQVSMSTKADALISIDRKMRAKREQILRDNHETEIPSPSIIPLFEDIDSVKNLTNYLNRIWEYAVQSRRLNQETSERFSEIIVEVFVAGSDLSQQVGQAAGMNLYKISKHLLTSWLAERGLIGKVRMKMGSGEPMQRQGGYYSNVVGKSAFIKSADSLKRFSQYLKASTRRSTEYAATPLIGVFAGGDLRTFQSNISEKLRYISVNDLAQLLYHVKESQKFYETEIRRAGEPLVETRLQFKTRGLKELERLTIGRKDDLFDDFLSILTDNFRQILYGREEDVVGIHTISYFIARTTPSLRDRPTVRPGQGVSGSEGQKILERIAQTIPFSRYGSLLRAIAHNQSQTVVLGINQLTSGLFRALDSFSQKYFSEGETAALIEDRILPNLPVYEILHTLRTYHDVDLIYLNKLEKAFPAGNSAFIALREDIDSLNKYLILFQRELLRRHGLNVTDFFDEEQFIADLLPTLRPDLAVILQQDFFNTNPDKLLASINGHVDPQWIEDTNKILVIPDQVKYFRSKIWDLLEQPVFQRVASFSELAIALHSLSSNVSTKELPFAPKKIKPSADISNFLKMSGDDNMRQFLAAAVEYLTTVSEGMVEVPINIIRAMKEVERIIKIEEQALSHNQQDLLRFYLLQIARLTGENG